MPQIVDQFGNAIDSRVLTASQTGEIESLRREHEMHPARGLTPARLHRILTSAETGSLADMLDLYEDMEERDAHIYAEMNKRRLALQSIEWEIQEPPGADAREKNAAALLRDLYAGLPDLNRVLFDASDAIGKGFANLEINWGRQGRYWLPAAITYRPQRWFRASSSDRNELRLRDNSTDGAALWPFGWIRHVHAARSGYIARIGLHRVLSWPYLFKNFAVRDLAEFLEIYGLPVRIGKYPSGASDDDRARLWQAVVSLGHNAAGIMPQSMQIEIVEAAKGTHDPFGSMINWCEASESKAIIGQTLSAQASQTGTQALGLVHNEVRLEIRNSDIEQIAATLWRDLNYPLLALNFGPIELRRVPRIVFDTATPEDIEAYATHLPELARAGVQIPVSYVRRKLKIPAPAEGEEVLQATAAAQPVSAGAATSALRAAAPARDAIDDLIDAAGDQWEPSLDALLAPLRREIEQLIAAGGTLRDLRARLVTVLPQMDVERLGDALARAAFTARLAGEADLDLSR